MRKLFPKFFIGMLLPIAAFTLPQKGQVAGGKADLEASARELNITTHEPRTAIEWDSFSIAENEAVRFHQQSADSAVLNNVLGGDISKLMGTLESKLGKVYIVNPNGIIIGKDALIDVGSLVASTLRITNEDFFNGNDHFAGAGSSKVINLGTIQAKSGAVHVISYQVENHGAIEADTVTLTAAKEAWLQPKGNKRVLIKTSVESAASEEDGVTNTGTIRALQTELDADGSIYKFAINHSGSIESSLQEENGRVYLRAEKGCAKVTGKIAAPGGDVEVLAERVGIDNEALIDVSHESQAGNILIGGDWRGENTPFRADHTYLGKDAALRANGLGSGSGGKVVLWGNLSSRVLGEVSVRGGSLGGDGGKIEISKVPLLASKKIYMDAPLGKAGMILLDPATVTITTASTDADVSEASGTYSFTNAGPWNIQGSDIATLLSTGNVEINADNGDATGGNGSITVDLTGYTLNIPEDKTLSLIADTEGTIQVNDWYMEPNLSGTLNLTANKIILGNSAHSTTGIIDLSSYTITLTHTGTAGTRSLEVYGGAISSVYTWIFPLFEKIAGDPAVTIDSGTASEARINNVTTANIKSLSITQEGSGLAFMSFKSTGGSLTATGDITLVNSGSEDVQTLRGDGHFTIDTPGAISLTNSGSGDMSISGAAILTIGGTTRFSSLELSTTSTGKAYILGDTLALHGARSSASASVALPQAVGEVAAPSRPVSNGLGYTPSDGDAYIWAGSTTLTLDFEDFTTSTSASGSATYLVASSDIIFGVQDQGDAPMWSLNSAQNLVFDAGTAGTIQFNEGLTQSGAGALTLRGKSILLGKSDHTHTNVIGVQTTSGALNVEWSAAGGTLGVYTGKSGNDGKAATLAATSGALTIAKASGFSGTAGDIVVESGAASGTAADAKIQGSLGVDITANDITVTSLGESANISTTGSGPMSIASSGEIAVLTSGSGKISSLIGETQVTISSCTGLSVTNSSSRTFSRAFIFTFSGSGAITSSGAVAVEVNGSGAGARASLEFGDGSGAGGDIEITSGSLSITNSSSGSGSSAYISTASNPGDITINTLGGFSVTSSGAGEDAYIDAVEALTISGSGSVTLSNTSSNEDVRVYLSGTTGLDVNSSGAITGVKGEFLAPTSGDIKLISDTNLLFSGETLITADTASSQSIILACDQASEAPGSGHIDVGSGVVMAAGGTTTSSGKLRIFCGYFENNTISTAANIFNGGAFSGVEDVADDNNIYGVVYDAGSLPSEYGAPYTFYYEDVTPTGTITAQVERANILLTSTLTDSSLLSQDAALTRLAGLRRSYVERGRPFKWGGVRYGKRRKVLEEK